MIDPLNDPRFPNRPQHPDFWRLANAINYIDGEATEGGRDVEEIIGAYIDRDSLIYVADQRVKRAFTMPAGLPPDGRNVLAMVMALYVDAFILGYRVASEEKAA